MSWSRLRTREGRPAFVHGCGEGGCYAQLVVFDGVRRTRTVAGGFRQVDVEHVPKRDHFDIDEPLIPGGYRLVCIEALKNATRICRAEKVQGRRPGPLPSSARGGRTCAAGSAPRTRAPRRVPVYVHDLANDLQPDFGTIHVA